MKPVHIFRHVKCEGPGYLGTFLQQQQIPYEVICIDEGVEVPVDLDVISGLVFMGGGMNVTDPLQWIQEEQALIRTAIEHNVPVMGICLGAQLMSAAMGGTITHGPGMEIGWHPVTPVPENKPNVWLNDLPDVFVPFHWHADTFSIPQDATSLLNSECRNNQAFVYKNCVALQFHLEMTTDMVKEWVRLFGSDIDYGPPCAQTCEDILFNLDEKISALHQCADVIFSRWIEGLG
jgi:GMP synthase-like glutamine amidotransferase